ncbi:hypothetical protein GCM10027280_49340 [Micromonospora polyrhachis]
MPTTSRARVRDWATNLPKAVSMKIVPFYGEWRVCSWLVILSALAVRKVESGTNVTGAVFPNRMLVSCRHAVGKVSSPEVDAMFGGTHSSVAPTPQWRPLLAGAWLDGERWKFLVVLAVAYAPVVDTRHVT